jgi:hypothetical protein
MYGVCSFAQQEEAKGGGERKSQSGSGEAWTGERRAGKEKERSEGLHRILPPLIAVLLGGKGDGREEQVCIANHYSQEGTAKKRKKGGRGQRAEGRGQRELRRARDAN